ncbi:MAG: peptidoglycan bridge formation glycyltransferase FemA/FemB family protein [Anaerolineaceae bacterium]|nr:peptidoglycan bridge formation glycyltransferase FemA/FemB family protein [Anaerolineaceae bacterium]
MKFVNDLDIHNWGDFVDQNPQGNIFHTPEMYEVFSRTKGHEPHINAVIEEKGNILALLPIVTVTLKPGLMSWLTSRNIAYGSILSFPGEVGDVAVSVLLQKYTQKSGNEALFTEFRNLADLTEIKPTITNSGFIYEDHLNYLIDINEPEETVWSGFSKNTRKSIRKSFNKGIVSEEIHDSSLIPIFYDLLKKTYSRARVPLADISLFEAVFDILVPKGMAKMYLARAGFSFVAASLELPYKDVIYSWYSGYDWSARSFNANDFLVWNILKWGTKNSKKIFDFGGAGTPSEPFGVRDFKSKFGGRLVNYGRYSFSHVPLLLEILRFVYKIFRRILLFVDKVKSFNTKN